MTINGLKDLKKIIQLCRSQGVEAIKIDGIELTLGALPVKATQKRIPQATYAGVNVIDEHTQIDVPDQLSEEDLLFYSATGQSN